jgi:hypothetical protein
MPIPYKRKEMFYVHSIGFGQVVLANSSARYVISIGNDADFRVKHIVIPAAAAGLTVQVEDSAGELWFDRAISVLVLGLGATALDRPLIVNRLIPRNTNLTLTIANTTGGNLAIDFALVGYKVNFN